MKKPVRNLFSDDDPEILARDLEAISKRPPDERSAAERFESYLDFLEEASTLFGVRNNRPKEKIQGDPPLVL